MPNFRLQATSDLLCVDRTITATFSKIFFWLRSDLEDKGLVEVAQIGTIIQAICLIGICIESLQGIECLPVCSKAFSPEQTTRDILSDSPRINCTGMR